MNQMFQKLLLVFTVLLISFYCNAQQINTLSQKEKEEGWELLFNGKDFDGWTKFNGKPVTGWKVIDGVLYNSGKGSDHGGDIITSKRFESFELYVEWSIAPKSNSGIFYRVNPTKANIIYETGPEYQLLDDKGWPTKLESTQYTGANYAMNPPVNAKVKPIGDWNTARIIVDGDTVQHFLNGIMVVEYEFFTDEWKENKANGKWKDKPHYGMTKNGFIGFQDHGGLCQFRNIKLRIIENH